MGNVPSVKTVGMEPFVHVQEIVIQVDVTKSESVIRVVTDGLERNVFNYVLKIVMVTCVFVMEIVSVVRMTGMGIDVNVQDIVQKKAVTRPVEFARNVKSGFMALNA
jgi:hypothetical protein